LSLSSWPYLICPENKCIGELEREVVHNVERIGDLPSTIIGIGIGIGPSVSPERMRSLNEDGPSSLCRLTGLGRTL
jgi:hypothetical protein